MTRLSGMVAADGDEAGATCLYAVYDPASRRCRLTSAGHLPPALRDPGGTVEFLDLPGGVMLGAAQGRRPPRPRRHRPPARPNHRPRCFHSRVAVKM